MASKKSTILFLPGGSSKVRRISLHNKVIFILTSLLILLIGGLLCFVTDYRNIRTQIPELRQLQKENMMQKNQLVALCKEINDANKRIAALQKFDHKLRVMTNLESAGEQGQFLGVGGPNMSTLKPEYQLEEVHGGLIRQMHQSLENLDTEIAVTDISQTELNDFLSKQKSLLACTPSIRPTVGWVSSGFGYRISPFTNKREFHKGLDIATRIGTPVVAPADGLIVFAAREGNYGKLVTINHGYNLKTRFGHLYKFRVKKGAYVKRGEIIAEVGNSGRCTGPHLHYEVLLNGVPVNPLRYILN